MACTSNQWKMEVQPLESGGQEMCNEWIIREQKNNLSIILKEEEENLEVQKRDGNMNVKQAHFHHGINTMTTKAM